MKSSKGLDPIGFIFLLPDPSRDREKDVISYYIYVEYSINICGSKNTDQGEYVLDPKSDLFIVQLDS